MSLLKLELLRLVRTWRGPGLLAVFLLFGIMGPLMARYQEAIISHLGNGNGIQITVPPAQPVDGIVQYLGNATQLGVLLAVVVAIGALNFDAEADVAIFLRTRVSVRRLLLLRYSIYAIGVALTFLLGALLAWYETALLLGGLPVLRLLAGLAYGMLFYVYVIALAALAVAWSRSTIGGVLIALALLTVPDILTAIPAVSAWLPTSLGNAPAALVKGSSVVALLRPASVATVVAAMGLWFSLRRLERREI